MPFGNGKETILMRETASRKASHCLQGLQLEFGLTDQPRPRNTSVQYGGQTKLTIKVNTSHDRLGFEVDISTVRDELQSFTN